MVYVGIVSKFELESCVCFFSKQCTYFEAVVYGNEHCTTLKNAAKVRKSVGSVIEYDRMQENMQQIADMIKGEKQNELSVVRLDGATQDGQAVVDGKPASSDETTPKMTRSTSQ